MRICAAKLTPENHSCLKWCLKCCMHKLRFTQTIVLPQVFFCVSLVCRHHALAVVAG